MSVRSVAVNSTVLLIQWEEPAVGNRHGVIRRYFINVTEQETGNEDHYYSENLYITIGSRHPFYRYSYSVSAETVKPGPFSLQNYIRMPEAGME